MYREPGADNGVPEDRQDRLALMRATSVFSNACASPPRRAVSSVTAFDTLKTARHLKAAGVPPEQAEAHAEALRRAAVAGHDELATKSDIRRLETDIRLLKSDIRGLVTRGEFYRALWMQAAGIIGLIVAMDKLL